MFLEPDIYHMYNARGRFPDPVDGSLWDSGHYMQNNWKRLVGWHVKDANRTRPAGRRPRATRSRRRDAARLHAQRRRSTSSTPPRATSATAPLAASRHVPTLGSTRRAPGGEARSGPAVWGFRREFTEIMRQPREGLQVPHRGVRLGPRPRRRPRPLAAARQDQRQAPARAEVARHVVRFIAGGARRAARAPVRPCGRAGARRRFDPLSRDRLALPGLQRPRPSQATELKLMGLLEAAKKAGYPIKVSLAR